MACLYQNVNNPIVLGYQYQSLVNLTLTYGQTTSIIVASFADDCNCLGDELIRALTVNFSNNNDSVISINTSILSGGLIQLNIIALSSGTSGQASGDINICCCPDTINGVDCSDTNLSPCVTIPYNANIVNAPENCDSPYLFNSGSNQNIFVKTTCNATTTYDISNLFDLNPFCSICDFNNVAISVNPISLLNNQYFDVGDYNINGTQIQFSVPQNITGGYLIYRVNASCNVNGDFKTTSGLVVFYVDCNEDGVCVSPNSCDDINKYFRFDLGIHSLFPDNGFSLSFENQCDTNLTTNDYWHSIEEFQQDIISIGGNVIKKYNTIDEYSVFIPYNFILSKQFTSTPCDFKIYVCEENKANVELLDIIGCVCGNCNVTTLNWYVDDVLTESKSYNNVDLNSLDNIFDYEFQTEGTHTVKLEVCNCCGCCETTTEVFVGKKIIIDRLDCYKYFLKDNNTYQTTTAFILIKDLDGNLIKQYEFTNYVGKTSLEFIVSEDNIYKIEYYVGSITNSNLIESFIIYELCGLLECYKLLLKDVICTCLSECYKQDMITFYHRINAFFATASMFLASIFLKGDSETFSLFYWEDKYLDVVKNTKYYMNKMKEICNGCSCWKPTHNQFVNTQCSLENSKCVNNIVYIIKKCN